MSKYIIEIEEKPLCVFDKDTQTYFPRLWRVKGFNSLVFDEDGLSRLEELNSDYINEHFGQLQDEAYKQGYADAERIWRAPSSDNEFYQKGLEDAWKAARRIVVDTDRGGFTLDALREIFGTQGFFCIMQDNTAQEAIDKIKAYEDKQKEDDSIKVGDEVATETGIKYTVVSFGHGGTVCGFNAEGKWTGWKPKEVTKTGKHYDIQSILEAMRTHD